MAKKSLQDINPLEYDLSTNVSVSPKQQTDRLIQLGKGVYKDKISGKLLYNYDEMPTAEVVGHKKEKSINDNWQKAYAKGIPSGTMASDMETMNAVTGGALNWTMPSQLIGATGRLINDRDFGQFGRNLILGNSGIVTDNFHKEHPYWSIAANGAFDAFTGRSLYNINRLNQTKPLLTSIGKGIGKTIIEVPYNIVTNNNVQTYGRKIVNPIINYGRDIINPIETIKAIKDGRYTPFMTKQQAKNLLIKNSKRLQSRFNDAYDFNKEIEANKSFPVDINEQYKSNIDNWDIAWKERESIGDINDAPYKNSKPLLHINPLKTNVGQKFYDAYAYYTGNEVYIPSRTSKHILTDPNSFKIKHILSHEINHHIQDVIPKYRTIGNFDKNVGYYVVNENNDLANKIFAPIKKNSLKEKTNWAGSPYEVQSDMAGLKYILNNPANYSNQPWYNKLYMKHYISKHFNISSSEADKMLNNMSRHSFAMGGHINN